MENKIVLQKKNFIITIDPRNEEEYWEDKRGFAILSCKTSGNCIYINGLYKSFMVWDEGNNRVPIKNVEDYPEFWDHLSKIMDDETYKCVSGIEIFQTHKKCGSYKIQASYYDEQKAEWEY